MILFILIFFVMVIIIGASAVIGFSFYLKRRAGRLAGENQKQFADAPPYRSLFAPSDEEVRQFEQAEQIRRETEDAENKCRSLLARAAENNLIILVESQNNKDLYDEILNKLVHNADSDEKISALVKFILAKELGSNAETVEKFSAVWRKNPDKNSTLNYLEIAARAGSAEIYLAALEKVMEARRNGTLNSVESDDLIGIAESGFWLLPPDEKASGAGFLLKEKLADLRREMLKEK